MQEAQAQLVTCQGQTTVGKVTETVLRKVAEHQTGKVVKISNILSLHDLERLIKVRAQSSCRWGGRMGRRR